MSPPEINSKTRRSLFNWLYDSSLGFSYLFELLVYMEYLHVSETINKKKKKRKKEIFPQVETKDRTVATSLPFAKSCVVEIAKQGD